jgi:hypothetical protein
MWIANDQVPHAGRFPRVLHLIAANGTLPYAADLLRDFGPSWQGPWSVGDRLAIAYRPNMPNDAAAGKAIDRPASSEALVADVMSTPVVAERPNPWPANLRADRRCLAQRGRSRRQFSAREATPEEIERWWPPLVRLWPPIRHTLPGNGGAQCLHPGARRSWPPAASSSPRLTRDVRPC